MAMRPAGDEFDDGEDWGDDGFNDLCLADDLAVNENEASMVSESFRIQQAWSWTNKQISLFTSLCGAQGSDPTLFTKPPFLL